jgi:flagellar biosynthetic protein FlhB
MPDTSKTEHPTPRRLDKARQEGHIPQSQEMLSAISLIALTLTSLLCAPWLIQWSKRQILEGLSCRIYGLDDPQTFLAFADSALLEMLKITAPFFLALTLAGTAGCILVSGYNFAPKALAWKPENLNPVRGLMSLFSPESLVRLGLSTVKILFLAGIVWLYLHDKLDLLAALQWMPPEQILASIGRLILAVVLRICAGLLILAAADLFYQRWRYIEKLKMTKQEVKTEYRDMEGSPEVKSKIRQKQIEAATRRMLQEVPKANVVLVNPDHVAVALKYDPSEASAPIVVAKGADHLCEKIKEIARAYGVPILRRPPLARELYATVKLGHPIPETLYTAVAEILALLYRLRHTR